MLDLCKYSAFIMTWLVHDNNNRISGLFSFLCTIRIRVDKGITFFFWSKYNQI